MIISFESLNDEDKLLFKRITDIIDIAHFKNKTRFSSFLNPHQLEVAIFAAKKAGFERYLTYGGNEICERAIFGAFSNYDEISEKLFPISTVNFRFRKIDSLSHRDFLGSFMSKLIKREAIGDIFVAEGCATVFCMDTVSDIIHQTEKIGRVGVKISETSDALSSSNISTEMFEAIVSSLRLDCIVSAFTGLSRGKSTNLINSGLVSVDYRENTNCSQNVTEKSVIAIRGYGKFVFNEQIGMTKKGRYAISYSKYK